MLKHFNVYSKKFSYDPVRPLRLACCAMLGPPRPGHPMLRRASPAAAALLPCPPLAPHLHPASLSPAPPCSPKNPKTLNLLASARRSTLWG